MKKILICDDDEGIIDVLSLMLEDTGHNIIAETNSLNAYAIIEAEKPDLMILDLWMPVLSGDQILNRIRMSPQHQTLPVIVISASRDGEEIAKNAGATIFIAKPFDMDHLLAVVQDLLTE
jgi:CheY-like chemotaxis protein